LSRQLLSEFNEALENARKEKARVVIINSSVEKVFCAGADLKERWNDITVPVTLNLTPTLTPKGA